jgi:hypothetical protein
VHKFVVISGVLRHRRTAGESEAVAGAAIPSVRPRAGSSATARLEAPGQSLALRLPLPAPEGSAWFAARQPWMMLPCTPIIRNKLSLPLAGSLALGAIDEIDLNLQRGKREQIWFTAR